MSFGETIMGGVNIKEGEGPTKADWKTLTDFSSWLRASPVCIANKVYHFLHFTNPEANPEIFFHKFQLTYYRNVLMLSVQLMHSQLLDKY